MRKPMSGPYRSRNLRTPYPGLRSRADRIRPFRPGRNSQAAPGMVRVLEEAGWAVSRVSPYDDLAWVGLDWCEEVRRLLESRDP